MTEYETEKFFKEVKGKKIVKMKDGVIDSNYYYVPLKNDCDGSFSGVYGTIVGGSSSELQGSMAVGEGFDKDWRGSYWKIYEQEGYSYRSCSCDSFDLMNFGCKCGVFDKEQKESCVDNKPGKCNKKCKYCNFYDECYKR